MLGDGSFWPVSATLTSKRHSTPVKAGDRIALRDGEGFMLAVLSVSESWQESTGLTCYSGNIEGATLLKHPDFAALRMSPAELRAQFGKRGWNRVVAWQAREPMHRAQFEFCLKSAIENESNLLLHPPSGR